jgi:hypothetical protein
VSERRSKWTQRPKRERQRKEERGRECEETGLCPVSPKRRTAEGARSVQVVTAVLCQRVNGTPHHSNSRRGGGGRGKGGVDVIRQKYPELPLEAAEEDAAVCESCS